MKLNVRRKVREINLKANDLLLPLYEVIVNAIQAIEDKKEINGLIKIEIIRNKEQIKIEKYDNIYPISSFIVSDNGVGFNQIEFTAFNDAYTERKLARGGKGVGRFTVLSAFKQMDIESVFIENGKLMERKFSFSVENEIEETKRPIETQNKQTGSKIYLNDYHSEFALKSQLTLEAICEEIVSHTLVYFLTGIMPRILVTENDKTQDLADYYNHFLFEQKVKTFKIDEYDFNAYFLKKTSNKGSHQIQFCAHNRLVKSIPIKSLIPNLYSSIGDNGSAHYISIFVTSNYLNDNLNEVRNSFTFPNKENEKIKDLFRKISLEEIEKTIKCLIENEYEREILAIEDDKLSKINDYVLSGKGIEYRHLLDYHSELALISPEDLANDKLDNELHKLNYQLEKKHKADITKVLAKSVDNTEEYSEELKKY
jgi:hypothetical protein